MNPHVPKDSEFEISGYFEEFIDADTNKFLGIRLLAEPDRPLGTDGRVLYALQADLHLQKGYKAIPVTIKASPGQPRRVFAMVQAICGRKRNTGFRHNEHVHKKV